MRRKGSISDEDRSNVANLVSKYPELARLKEGLIELFPEHDRLMIGTFLIDNPTMKIREHHLILLGLVARSKGLLSAALRETLKEDNPAVAAVVRSQCETLAAAYYIEENPDRLRGGLFGSREQGASVQATNILTQVDHADKKHPGLRKDYDQWSEFVHPNSASHFSPIRIVDEDTRTVEFSPDGYMKPENAVMAVKLMYFWTKWFLETARSIHEIFKAGGSQ